MYAASPPARNIRDPCRGLVEEDPPDRRTFGDRLLCGVAMMNYDQWDDYPIGLFFPDLDEEEPEPDC